MTTETEIIENKIIETGKCFEEVIYNLAVWHAETASKNIVPHPVRWGSAKTIFDTEIDPDEPSWVEDEGLCGFAWVTIRPARGEFVKYLKSRGIGHKNYTGSGWTINTTTHDQSFERNEAWANSFCATLEEYDIHSTVTTRLD